ncbi:MAG TPA: aminotransferase class I/II-fold pyridoxal phosphate-dependent enzyme [Actinomycetota bacterium]|nr:aminotransferase class I/II-fold pyridoxal phosphate-dependent enzyme [Actinomycetota bacterium]
MRPVKHDCSGSIDGLVTRTISAMTGFPLEPDRAQMEEIGKAALDLVMRFIEDRHDAPAVDIEGAYELAARLRSGPPESGGDLDELMATIRAAADKAYDAAGPGYLAYIPGGGLFTSAVAEMISRSINRFTNLAAPAPALVQLEANVCRWLCDLFSYPEQAQGVLTTGGSMANFGAVVTARETKARDNFRDAVIYVSDQAHHSMRKAARIAGFPDGAVQEVPTDADLRIDLDALNDAIQRDRNAQRIPLVVVGNAGTTNTGAVDDLNALAELARANGLWFHVDAAYGGFFRLTERGRTALAGIEKADSITLDPHKGMFLGYGTGSLLVRDGSLLKAAHQVGASYLPHSSDDAAIPDFSDYTPELSRDYRGLRVWMPLWLHGVGAFRDALDEKLDLTRIVYDALRSAPDLEVPWEPDLTVVAFRPKRGGNAATEALLDRINASKRIFISPTVVGGRLTLRVCIVSHRTHRERIDEGIEIIQKAVADL